MLKLRPALSLGPAVFAQAGVPYEQLFWRRQPRSHLQITLHHHCTEKECNLNLTADRDSKLARPGGTRARASEPNARPRAPAGFIIIMMTPIRVRVTESHRDWHASDNLYLTNRNCCLVQVGNGIELEAVGLRFEPYRWCPCGVT